MFDKFLLMLFLRNKDKLFALYRDKDKDFQINKPYMYRQSMIHACKKKNEFKELRIK